MQVSNKYFQPVTTQKQNFKGSSVNRDVFAMIPKYNATPLNVAKAYISPQIAQGYKEIETFEVPYVGKGKLYELSNGHRVILIKKIGPTVINTYIGCGNNNELQRQDETCHLLEHLLANFAIKPKEQEIKDILSRSGANYNATTSTLWTSYCTQAPVTKENEIEDLIKLQSDVLKNNNFTQKEIDKEKEIIKQEAIYRNKDKNSGKILLRNLSKNNLFNLKNNIKINCAQKTNDFKSITKESLNNFYNTFYHPQNMVTSIVGNIDDNTIKIFSKYFGQKNPPTVKNLTTTNNYLCKPLEKTLRKDYKNPDPHFKVDLVDLSFVGPQNGNYWDFILMLGLKEHLTQKIIENNINSEKQISLEPFYGSSSLGNNGHKIFSISGSNNTDETENTLKTLYSIIYDLRQNPISDEELKIVKNKLKAAESTECEKSMYLSDSYAQAVMVSQNVKNDTEYFNVINAMTAQDITNFTKKYLDLNKASIVVIHPQKNICNENIKNTKNISFSGNDDLLDVKNIKEYELPNNLRVVIDSRPGVSKSTVRFDLRSKENIIAMPKAPSILADYFLVPPLMKNKLSNEGISIINGGNSKNLYARVSGEPEDTIKMLNCLTNAVIYPAFSEEEFKNYRKLYNFESDKPQEEDAIQKFKNELYPYNDDAGSLKYLQVQDAIFLHKQILDNAQGVITITAPKENLQPIQNNILNTLRKLPKFKKFDYSAIFNSSKDEMIKKTKILLIPIKDNQVEIEKHFKIKESGNINDIAGLSVLNKLLGGSEDSKLFNKLRNENKIAYAPYSTYDRENCDGKFSKITLSASIAANDKDLKTVIEEYDITEKELINNLVTKKEIENAKNKLKNDLLCKMETSEGRNEFLANNYNSFYGINYQKELFDAIDRVTPEQIQKLAKYYLTQPYLMSVNGNKGVIDNSKVYLKGLGEVINC